MCYFRVVFSHVTVINFNKSHSDKINSYVQTWKYFSQIPKKQKFLTLFLIKDLGSVENGHFF